MIVAHFLEGRTIRQAAFALTAVLAAPGVAMATDPPRPVTFAKDVAPILQQKCQHCHQPGSIAPMSLRTFEETRPWARAIKDRVMRRQMPPWHIDRTVGVQKFKNDMALSDDQIDTIVRWVDAGAPLGDPKDMPPSLPLITDNEWVAVEGRPGPTGSDHQGRPLHDAGAAPGRLVASPRRNRPDRAALGEGGRDPSLDTRWTTNRPPRRGLPGPGRHPGSINQGTVTAVTNNSNRDELVGRRAQFMEWAIGKSYDLVSSRHREAVAARLEDFLGHPHSCGRRGDYRQRRDGRLALPEGRGAKAPDLPHPVHRAEESAQRSTSPPIPWRRPRASRF